MERTSLSPERIKAGLATAFVGRPCTYLRKTGSTNDEAKRLAAAGAPAGALVIADEQTAGKGRLGRRWVAPPKTSLLMSLIFRPEWGPAQAFRLTMLCSLAAAEAIKARTGLEVGIKWPNDLVIPTPDSIRYRKLGGVLTENGLVGEELVYSVVGIGINVNLDPADLGPVMVPATSLQAELGRPVDRVALLIAILRQIERRYPQAIDGRMHGDWVRRLVTLGKSVVVSWGGECLHGVAEGVNKDGVLTLRADDGTLHSIAAGDVTLQPPALSTLE